MFHRSLRYVVGTLLAVVLALAPQAQAQQGPEIDAALTTETEVVAAGSTVRALARFTMSEGWHVNGHKPLDPFLIPTAIQLSEDTAATVVNAVYPEHTLFEVGGDTLAVYEHDFTIGLVLKLADDLPAGDQTLTGTLRYQACNDKMCMPPENLDLSFTLTIGTPGEPVEADRFAALAWPEAQEPAMTPAPVSTAKTGGDGPELSYTFTPEHTAVAAGTQVRALVQVTLNEGWHVNAHKPLDPFLIPTEVSLDPESPVTIVDSVYPEHKLFNVAGDDLAVYEHGFLVGLVLEVAADTPAGSLRIPGTLRYQACNDKMCMPPENLDLSFELTVGEASPPVNDDRFGTIAWEGALTPPVPGATPLPAPESTPGMEPSPEATGDWKALADQFDIIGMAGFEEPEAFTKFLEQGLAGEITPEAGTDYANMSWLLILLAIVGGGLALNLTPCVLPLIPVNIAIIGAGAKAGSRKRGFALGGAFGVGIALVYGLLGLAVMLSFTSAFGTINSTLWFNLVIMILFIVLALGMFDIIHIDFTRFQTKLGIRKNENGSFAVAFLMGAISALLAGACVAPVVISTILFAQDSYSQGNQFALALPFLLGVGMALPWPFVGAGLSVLPKPGMWMVRVKQAFGVFILLFAAYYGYKAYVLMQTTPVDSDAALEDGWHVSLEAGLEEALETGQPVFLDFWATWCTNCHVMDRTTLKDEGVVALLDSFVKIKYQAERMSESPAKEAVEYYGVVGLPAYVILQPKEK